VGSLKLVDLFCGAGGWSQGLIDAGHEIILALDSWQTAINTYTSNHNKHKAVKIDIMDLYANNELMNIIKEADVIIGSPPCKKFSTLNTTDRTDEMVLTDEFFKIVMAADKPFIMENVARVSKIMADIEAGKSNIEKKFYPGIGRVVKMGNYGIPQVRKRYIRSDIIDPMSYETKPGDIADYLPLFKKIDPKLNEKDMREPRPEVKERMSRVENGKQENGYNVYYRIPVKGQSTAIVNITKAMTIHPFEDRRLTVYEAAVLQTFPTDYKLFGNYAEIAEMVANAVPPLFAKQIGKALWEWDDNGRKIIPKQNELSL
jgi:DNA (cytosine-5)-methyltransferase 1